MGVIQKAIALACASVIVGSAFRISMEAKPCDASKAPLNGDVGNCTGTLISGTKCQPNCNPGYEVNGMTTCTWGVLWAAKCKQQVTCDASIPPKNGSIGNCSSMLLSGSKCQPTCNRGFKVDGMTTCTMGILWAAKCKERQRLTEKTGSGRLVGKALGSVMSASKNIKNALPGQAIMKAAKKKVVTATLKVLPNSTKKWMANKTLQVTKAVLKTEVGRNVMVGVVQGKKQTDAAFQNASDALDDLSPTLAKARKKRHEFHDNVTESISNIGTKHERSPDNVTTTDEDV
jgi:hypothetical protein